MSDVTAETDMLSDELVIVDSLEEDDLSNDEEFCEEKNEEKNVNESLLDLKRKADCLLEKIYGEPSNKMTKSYEVCKNDPDFSYFAVRDRLLSFAPPKWMGQPNVSVRDFARCGWVCCESALLRCVSCQTYLFVGLPSILDTDIALVKLARQEIMKEMIDGHEVTCKMRWGLWHDGEYDFSVSKYKADLEFRCASLRALPLSDFKLKQFDVICDDIVGQMESTSKQIATLASFGWTKSSADEDGVECVYCARWFPLDLYKESPFDPQSSHFPWCDYAQVEGDSTPVCLKRLQMTFASPNQVLEPEVELEDKMHLLASWAGD